MNVHVGAKIAGKPLPPLTTSLYDQMETVFAPPMAPGSDFNRGNRRGDDARLFALLVEFQSSLASVSMHLPPGFSTALSEQLADLLDPEDWDEDDELPGLDALQSALRTLIVIAPQRRPGLGSNGSGSITLFWRDEKSRLTIDCVNQDTVQWVLSSPDRMSGRERRAAGYDEPSNMKAILAAYDTSGWFAETR